MATPISQPFMSVKGTIVPFPEPKATTIEAMTESEYNALSPDEVAAGIYFVSDDIIKPSNPTS